MSISQKSSHQTHEAIVFFSDGDLIKEMLYTEFEALLDCVVPMRDFAGREMQAAYVRLDSSLAVVGVVLFKVNFDTAGFPEQSWNVPLRMLAEAGARGPDLGGGPARLATRSQCPVAGYADSLWDIQFGPAGNTLDQLRERLHGNRLGIDAVDLQPNAALPATSNWAQPAPAPSRSVGQPAPGPSAATGEGNEALLAAMQQSNQQIAALRQQHQREMLDLQQQFAEQQQRWAELQQRAHALENDKRLLLVQVEEHAQAAEEERVRGERKLQLVIEKARAQTAALRHELQHEREAALTESERRHTEAVAELNARTVAELAERDRHMEEELARLERERQLHEEQVVGMRTELTELRRDKLRLMDAGADQFFASLQQRGVKFVSFQPGAGHLTIPMEDLYRFIEDTPRYVAEKCKVSVDQYLHWLAHYNNPVCQGSAGHGGTCGKPLSKLLKPGEFVAGLHDRCDIHKQVPRSQPRDSNA